MTENGDDTTGLVSACPVCQCPVPGGEFCGACGAHLHPKSGHSPGRHRIYAADPAERMLHLSVITTLFPHLPHRHSGPFRVALAGAALMLLALGLLGVIGVAVVLSAALVPVLYVLYLYEVEVYEDEPVLVIGGTLVIGFLLGLVWARTTGAVVTGALLQNVAVGLSTGEIIQVAVVFPLIAQLLMLVGPLVLYVLAWRRYGEALV